MRLAILITCTLVAVGVFAAMFIAICSARRDSSRLSSFRQSLAAELVWAAIPCLMIAAAATPALMTIVQGN